jgi:predicted DNA-binding protein YlxM (UPF0122 family)
MMRNHEIVRLYTKEKLTLQQIGAAFGITRERVRQILHKRGIPSNIEQIPRDAAFVAKARRLWREGFSVSEIARQLNVTKNVIAGVSHRHDFPPRPSPIRRAG